MGLGSLKYLGFFLFRAHVQHKIHQSKLPANQIQNLHKSVRVLLYIFIFFSQGHQKAFIPGIIHDEMTPYFAATISFLLSLPGEGNFNKRKWGRMELRLRAERRGALNPAANRSSSAIVILDLRCSQHIKRRRSKINKDAKDSAKQMCSTVFCQRKCGLFEHF